MDVDLPNALKRCCSAPILPAGIMTMNTANNFAIQASSTLEEKQIQEETSPIRQNHNIQNKIINNLVAEKNQTSNNMLSVPSNCQGIVPQSNSACSSPIRSREASPAPINIFAPRARRYSASFAPSVANNGTTVGPRLTPRVSQLRQEECVDMNSREVNHEREVHSAMQMSQSWEDLTLVAENWSCKSDDLTNPLQVTLPANNANTNYQCSSPSPTSRTSLRFNVLSPSPTRRTFATRRSMSPIAMRPSQLGPVKRKFELDDGNWNCNYSSPPLKKIFTESSRGSSPICQSPSSICPSPDSGTYEGRITPKLFISKLCTNSTNSTSSMCSSPMVPSPVGGLLDVGIDIQSNTSNSSSPAGASGSSSSYISAATLSSGNNEPLEQRLHGCSYNSSIDNTTTLNFKKIKDCSGKFKDNEDAQMEETKITLSGSDDIIQTIHKLPTCWSKSPFLQRDQTDSESSSSTSSGIVSGTGLNTNGNERIIKLFGNNSKSIEVMDSSSSGNSFNNIKNCSDNSINEHQKLNRNANIIEMSLSQNEDISKDII